MGADYSMWGVPQVEWNPNTQQWGNTVFGAGEIGTWVPSTVQYAPATLQQYTAGDTQVYGGPDVSTAGYQWSPYSADSALERYKQSMANAGTWNGFDLPGGLIQGAYSMMGDDLWTKMGGYLNNVSANPSSFQFGPGFEFGTNLDAKDPLKFLESGAIGGQTSWAQQDFTNKMLQSIMSPEQYAALAPIQQQIGSATETMNRSNEVKGLLDGEIPWQVMVGLGLMTGGAMGLFGAAGSPMAAGGLLGEVGAGLGGAVASAGGAALDASALAAMGYNPANASLGGLTGATSGGGSLGGANGSWDILPDAVSQPTGGALPGDAGATGGIAPDVNADLTALMDSPAGGGGSMTDWWTQAISPGSNYTLSDLAGIAGLPSSGGGSDILKQLLGGQSGGSGTGTNTGTGTGTGGTSGMGSLLNWLTGTGTGSLGGLATGLMQYGEYGDQSDFLKSTMERAISASDPYGYGPYRKYAADQLQKTYTDPASIYASPEMQALDQMFMDKTMAGQSVSGNLFNAPERVSQRQNNFYANLSDYRKPLMQMSGSQFRPDTKAYYEFAGPIVQNELNRSASLGGAINAGLGGLGSILGGTGGTGDYFIGNRPSTGAGAGGLLNGITGIFGQPPSGGGGLSMEDLISYFGSSGSGAADVTPFYDAADLVDLFL